MAAGAGPDTDRFLQASSEAAAPAPSRKKDRPPHAELLSELGNFVEISGETDQPSRLTAGRLVACCVESGGYDSSTSRRQHQPSSAPA